MLQRPLILLGALLLAVALPGAAHAATLYTTLNGPSDVSGPNSEYAEGNMRVAQSFTPTPGTARVVSLFGQTLFGSGAGIVELAIHADSAGKPGAKLASGQGTVGETTSSSPTCFALSTGVALAAGQTYWAVFRGVDKGAAWLFWRQQPRTVLLSADAGATWGTGGASQKTFGLRVDDNAACGPDITPNPSAGMEIGELYAKPLGTSFNTVYVTNDGNQDLTLTGATFSGPDKTAFRLLQGEPTGPANQPFSFPATVPAGGQSGAILYVVCDGANPEGQRRATLTLTSNDADEGSISWPVLCIVDATPPTLAYSQNPAGRAGWHVTKPAGLQVQASDPGSGNRVKRIFCSDTNGPALEAFSSVATFGLSAEGLHDVSCRATDVADNTSAVGAYPTAVKIDTIGPDAAKGTGPAANVNATSAQFAFTTSDLTSGVQEIECRLDGGTYTACTSPASRAGLADGLHQFEVRARDVAGNHDPTPASWSWRVDTVAPDTSLSGGPAAVTSSRSASFTAAGSDPGGSGVARVQCSLDGAAFADCASPAAYTGLAEGPHTLRARATDLAGNVDPTAAERSWTIDLTPPTAVLTQKPPNRTGARTATFAFTTTDAGPAATAGFECRLDGAAFAACTSPVALQGLEADRSHTFEVRAIDTVGNVQASPTAHTWTVTDDPYALADGASTTAGTAVDVDVLANDADPKGGALAISAFDATSAQGGTVTQVAGKLRYTPPAGFIGTDTFTYRARNAGGIETEAATVTIDVRPAPAPFVVAPAPVIAPLQPSAVAPLDRTAPVVSKLRVRSRRATFTLSEAAKVTVVVERYVKGRKRPVKRSTIRRTGRRGANALRLSKKLPAGLYRLVVTAIDAAGNRSKAKRLTFRLSRR